MAISKESKQSDLGNERVFKLLTWYSFDDLMFFNRYFKYEYKPAQKGKLLQNQKSKLSDTGIYTRPSGTV